MHQLAPAEEVEGRCAAIVDFEKRVADAGMRMVNVMLHISYDEQKERLDRLDKHWKYNPDDVDERLLWDAYETVIERLSTGTAP